MATDPGNDARKKLLEIERRRQMAVVLEFEKIKRRLDADLADLLARIDKQRRIDGNASPGLLFQKARVGDLLDAVTDEIRKASFRLGLLTQTAQTSAIQIAKTQAAKTPELHTNLNFFDAPATRELIGIAGDGSPLAVHFATLAAPLRTAMFDALFYGIAAGKGNGLIAREVRDAIGGTTARAMTIVRTETNRAYREATRQFYTEAPGVIGWRWLAALDLRTCPICWALHGKIFKTKTKFGTHPNCRCTLTPVFADEAAKETGPELFAKLNDAQRKTIVGPRRLELYKQGAELSDFVETTKTTFGLGRQIKPLDRTKFKPRERRPDEPPFPGSIRPDVPKPRKVKPAPATPDPALSTTIPEPIATPAAVEFNAAAIRTEFVAAAKARRPAGLDQITADLTAKVEALRLEINTPEIRSLPYSEYKPFQDKIAAARDALNGHLNALRQLAEADRPLLKVADPVEIVPHFDAYKGSFPRTKPDRKANVETVVRELNGFISQKAWPGNKNLAFKHSNARAHYQHWQRTVVANFDSFSGRRTIAHEISHSLEMSNPDNLRAANEFLDYRTPGEKLVRLKKLRPNYSYRSDELTRPDKFADPYVGKAYGPPGNQEATEVISMGIEQMFADPLRFAEADPDYFDFILHIMRGEKWSKPK